MKLEPMHFDIQDPLTGMERWNEAVGLAREKNRELTDNMGAMGNAMGNVGNLIGGAAGQCSTGNRTSYSASFGIIRHPIHPGYG